MLILLLSVALSIQSRINSRKIGRLCFRPRQVYFWNLHFLFWHISLSSLSLPPVEFVAGKKFEFWSFLSWDAIFGRKCLKRNCWKKAKIFAMKCILECHQLFYAFANVELIWRNRLKLSVQSYHYIRTWRGWGKKCFIIICYNSAWPLKEKSFDMTIVIRYP